MDSYVAVSIAVAGWIATHILTLRAQTRNLRLQVLDRARGEATEALRAGQSWFSSLATTVILADVSLHLEQQGMTADWNSHVQKILILQHSVPTAWIMRLEEYEILFPEAAPVRERLVGRQRTIMSKTSEFLSQIMPSAFGKGSPASRQQAIVEALKWLPEVHDHRPRPPALCGGVVAAAKGDEAPREIHVLPAKPGSLSSTCPRQQQEREEGEPLARAVTDGVEQPGGLSI